MTVATVYKQGWTLDDVHWDWFDPSRVEPNLLAAVKAAIREHGYASAAAKALGISYRQLTWQLHKVGLSIRDVLAGDD